jgi:serralysin
MRQPLSPKNFSDSNGYAQKETTARWRTSTSVILGMVLACRLGAASVRPGEPVTYNTFQGQSLQLVPWFGKSVVVLTLDGTLDPAVMADLVSAVNRAYFVYRQFTRQSPEALSSTVLEGRAIVAEVPDGATCGAGCGFLGLTGIELTATTFGDLYDGIRLHGQYDQAVFYELGRNFWFYRDQLGALDPFVTGFAIANRFVSMERAHLDGGLFGTLPFDEFKSSILTDLLDDYLADPSLDWRNTLLLNVGPPNLHHWGAADLAGAMMYRIYAENGFAKYRAFWTKMAELPLATSPESAVQNFVLAAFAATGKDYGYLFKAEFAATVTLIEE